MDMSTFTPEQQAQFKNAKTPEEMLELAQEEGMELSDEMLEGVVGGAQWRSSVCTDDLSDVGH